MIVLHFTKAISLDQLYDELLAALPVEGPLMRVEGSASEVYLTAPDTIDQTVVRGVVESHVPRIVAPPPAPTAAQRDAIRLLADPTTVPTNAQVVAAVRAIAVVIRDRLGA